MAGKYVWIKLIAMSGERLELEPRWWPAEELCRDPRFTRTNETGSYFDWDAKLTPAEFQELHDRFLEATRGGLFADPGWQKVIAPKLQLIDLALAGGIGTIDRCEVGVHEWESGY